MAERRAAKDQAAAGKSTEVEAKVVALAEQIGWFLGTVQAKADGWLEDERLTRNVGRIRDGASELLKYMNRAGAQARQVVAKGVTAAKSTRTARSAAAPKPAAAPKVRASRGPVDAPGKRHRKPPPQERIDPRMGEPVGKKMGQKQFRVGKSRGRG